MGVALFHIQLLQQKDTMNILLIDDQPEILDIYQRFFSGLGITNQTTARTCEEGYEKVAGTFFDVIITDFNTKSQKTGADVLREARARSSETDVIIISGEIDPETQRGIRRLGADATLPKPCKLERIIQVLRDLGRYFD